MLNVTIIGASGRTGSLVLQAAIDAPDYHVCGAIVSENSGHRGKIAAPASVNHGEEVIYSSNIESGIDRASVVIDFSSPAVSLSVAKACAARRVPLLLATTGHSEKDLHDVKALSAHLPFLLAPNTSLVVLAQREAARAAHRILGSTFDIEIFEVHHRHKKDSPSGTALSLAHSIKGEGVNIVRHREGQRGDHQIGVSAARGGDVAGEHTIFFLGEGERLEITQRATSRQVFASGALALARRLAARSPGSYDVQDLFSLTS